MLTKRELNLYLGYVDGVYEGWGVLVGKCPEDEKYGLVITSREAKCGCAELKALIIDLRDAEVMEVLEEGVYFDYGYGDIDHLVYEMVDCPAFIEDANNCMVEALHRAIMKAHSVMYNRELEKAAPRHVDFKEYAVEHLTELLEQAGWYYTERCGHTLYFNADADSYNDAETREVLAEFGNIKSWYIEDEDPSEWGELELEEDASPISVLTIKLKGGVENA